MKARAVRPYHHGNLKEELLASALKLIGTVGPRAFTLREVARQAKVSHNAPYRHFRDKDDLLAAIASDGFHRLAEAMLAAAAPAADPLERLLMSGKGYVQFALHYPDHFSIMFDYCDDPKPNSEHSESGRRAFQVLLDAIAAGQAVGQLPAIDPHSLALIAWSQVHGIAKLAIGGQAPFESEDSLLQFVDFATHALVVGLANLKSA